MLVSVCAACVCVSMCGPLTTLHLCVQRLHSPLMAIWHAELKLKPPFLPCSSKITVSGFYLSFPLYVSHSLLLPPHPFCLPSPLGTGERFALITELLFILAEKDRDTLQTPTPAHCHALSTAFHAYTPSVRVDISFV